jgi:SAM-dependent methyltransferase
MGNFKAKNYRGNCKIDLSNTNKKHTKEIELIGRNKRVLEFGCYEGMVAGLLFERGCTVTGIELDRQAAEMARNVCDRVIVADIEEIDLLGEFKEERFDVGLFGDVLEHLQDPGKVLVQMRQLLAPGGFIVISVPNIAHASIRLMLLGGNFDYSEFGILDDTHVQFFTYDSIKTLLDSCGYMVEVVDPAEVVISPVRLQEELDPLGVGDLKQITEALSDWKSTAFQYVVRAFPADDFEQVIKLCDSKVELERRLRALERKVGEYKAEADQMPEARAYIKKIEHALESKNHEMEDLAAHANGVERALAERDEQLQAANGQVAELEVALARRFPSRLRHYLSRARQGQKDGGEAI